MRVQNSSFQFISTNLNVHIETKKLLRGKPKTRRPGGPSGPTISRGKRMLSMSINICESQVRCHDSRDLMLLKDGLH